MDQWSALDAATSGRSALLNSRRLLDELTGGGGRRAATPLPHRGHATAKNDDPSALALQLAARVEKVDPPTDAEKVVGRARSDPNPSRCFTEIPTGTKSAVAWRPTGLLDG